MTMMISRKQVEGIIGKGKVNNGSYFLVKWMYKPDEDSTWQINRMLKKCHDQTRQFNQFIKEKQLPFILDKFSHIRDKKIEQLNNLQYLKNKRIEKVLGKNKSMGSVQYLIKWEGYNLKDSTWERSTNLDVMPQIRNDRLVMFNRSLKNKKILTYPYIDTFALQIFLNESQGEALKKDFPQLKRQIKFYKQFFLNSLRDKLDNPDSDVNIFANTIKTQKQQSDQHFEEESHGKFESQKHNGDITQNQQQIYSDENHKAKQKNNDDLQKISQEVKFQDQQEKQSSQSSWACESNNDLGISSTKNQKIKLEKIRKSGRLTARQNYKKEKKEIETEKHQNKVNTLKSLYKQQVPSNTIQDSKTIQSVQFHSRVRLSPQNEDNLFLIRYKDQDTKFMLTDELIRKDPHHMQQFMSFLIQKIQQRNVSMKGLLFKK